jgi:hypothetical protein
MAVTIGEQDAEAVRKAVVCILEFLNIYYIHCVARHPRLRFASHESQVTNHGFSNRHLAIRNGHNSLKTNDGHTV